MVQLALKAILVHKDLVVIMETREYPAAPAAVVLLVLQGHSVLMAIQDHLGLKVRSDQLDYKDRLVQPDLLEELVQPGVLGYLDSLVQVVVQEILDHKDPRASKEYREILEILGRQDLRDPKDPWAYLEDPV